VQQVLEGLKKGVQLQQVLAGFKKAGHQQVQHHDMICYDMI
jgi:hypothetical protein